MSSRVQEFIQYIPEYLMLAENAELYVGVDKYRRLELGPSHPYKFDNIGCLYFTTSIEDHNITILHQTIN